VSTTALSRPPRRKVIKRLSDEVEITEDIVLAAAVNERVGYNLMKLLLDEREFDIRITQRIIKTASANEGNGGEIMKLLLNIR
jgi:hypothetical protein